MWSLGLSSARVAVFLPRMTGTSGATAMAIVSRTGGLPLTAVDFTDSRTRTRREVMSTHTISPTMVFDETAGVVLGVVAADADFGALAGATRSARRRTRAAAMTPLRARGVPGPVGAAWAASDRKLCRLGVRGASPAGLSGTTRDDPHHSVERLRPNGRVLWSGHAGFLSPNFSRRYWSVR